MAKNSISRRDLFEIENARNLTRDELVSTFIPTQSFWRLLSAKNHIVLGSRGSGKTALAKMLSHDHLSRLREQRAQRAVGFRPLVGIYVPTKLEWVGGLKNKPWQNEREQEEFFQWRLNLATCLAFLVTLQNCLETYISNIGQRARQEAEISHALSRSWLNEGITCDTLLQIQRVLEDLEYEKQVELARRRSQGITTDLSNQIGVEFDTDLFVPLRRGITVATRYLSALSNCTWLLCLDEAEFLEPMHHRILNSHMRTHSGNLFFKITTMPYAHHTLETNTGVSLNVHHDFEYVYIDQDPILLSSNYGENGQSFSSALFNKRAEVSGGKYRGNSLRDVLGPSKLLDSKREDDWGESSTNALLLKKHATSGTLRRAEKLRDNHVQFMDQIARKLHGALLLKEAVANLRGRAELDVYAGAAMAIRCSDANPRRLIRIFNSFLLKAKWKAASKGRRHVIEMDAKQQNRILTAFSASTLYRVQSEPVCGSHLYRFLTTIGAYMHRALHDSKLSTDQISSITIDKDISAENWNLIKSAVGLGLLFPNISTNDPDEMPEKTGTFHLAYVLAPFFQILPRRGKAQSLAAILRDATLRGSGFPSGDPEPQEEQLPLEFLEGG